MDKTKLDKIWKNFNENERFGLSFGLFPVRIMDEKLTNEESAELVKMSKAQTGIQY